MNLSSAVLSQNAARVAFGSITGTYANLLVAGGNVTGLLIRATLDAEVVLSLNGGSNDHIYIQPSLTSNQIMIDFAALGISYSGTIQVKHLGAAPTTGVLTVLAIGRR